MERFKKNCPYCGEEIMASAKKCRHCGEWLEQSYNDVPNNSSEIDYSNMSVNRFHNITLSTIRKVAFKTCAVLGIIFIFLLIGMCSETLTPNESSEPVIEQTQEENNIDKLSNEGELVELGNNYKLTGNLDGEELTIILNIPNFSDITGKIYLTNDGPSKAWALRGRISDYSEMSLTLCFEDDNIEDYFTGVIDNSKYIGEFTEYTDDLNKKTCKFIFNIEQVELNK